MVINVEVIISSAVPSFLFISLIIEEEFGYNIIWFQGLKPFGILRTALPYFKSKRHVMF